MKTGSVFRPALVVTVCTILLALPGCRIVSDDQRAKVAASGQDNFDAGKYVDAMWSSKVMPFFAGKAVDLAPVIEALKKDPDAAGKQYGHRADAEGSPWSFAVKGKGTVDSVNTESRAGAVVVDLPVGAASEKVTLQVGPVVRGTAIRDSLPFFSFGDVTNQIQFAQIGRSLNDRAVAAVHPNVGKLAAGTVVEFTGAMSVSGAVTTFTVTPVALTPAGSPP
jgi:predicted lipoprotein